MKRPINFAAAAFCLCLAACSNNTIEEGDAAAVRESYESAIASLSDYPAQARGYSLALYRALTPREMPVVEDDFDPAKPLVLATERPGAPAPGSDEYIEIVRQGAHRIAGMEPATVVDLYVSQDGALLSRQEQWVRSWQARTRIKNRNDVQEAERRKALLEKFKALRPAYFWEKGRPYLKYFMYNPLDVPLDRVETDFDLFDQAGQQRLGSARVQGLLRTPLQPGVQATVLIDLSAYESLARPEFRNLGETYQVQIAFRNAWSGEKSLIDRDQNDDALVQERNKAMVNLLARIREAKDNLSKFRVTFAEERS